MSAPFFTVAIPSKNRPDRLANGIRSVLEQTFTDFELIVCDNSDAPEAVQTAALVQSFADPRVRYVRTSGQLSMPDNWEHSVAEARGEYVGILTDRSVFRRNALQTAYDEIARTGTKVVCWYPDHYGRGPSGREFRRRKSSLQSYVLESAQLIHYFLEGHPKYSSKVVPKLMTAMCQRSVLDTIRRSAVGRVCPPVCPDFTSGLLMLGHTESIVLIDDGMYVSCGLGNGSAFRRRGPLAERFRHDLGMSWKDLVDRMPSEACFTHALVLNDFMRIKELLPERYAPFELDRVQYYLGCLTDYSRASRHGADRSEDLDALIYDLAFEAPEIQTAVRSRQAYLSAVMVLPLEFAGNADQEEIEDDSKDAVRFDTVFDALAWAETNPRTPSAPGLGMPGLDQMKTWTGRKGNQRGRVGVMA